MRRLLLLLLILPAIAQSYPPVLIEVLGYDLLSHHYQKAEIPVFSVLGGGRRELLSGRMAEVPDSTLRALIEEPDGTRRIVRVEGQATRVYDLRGREMPLSGLRKGASYAAAFYAAQDPVVTQLIELGGDPGLGAVPAARPRTLPVMLGTRKVHPPQGWQATVSGGWLEMSPRAYRGKLKPFLFVRPLESTAQGSEKDSGQLVVLAREGSEQLAVWAHDDQVLMVRMLEQDGLAVALFCLLEDYQRVVPGYLELRAGLAAPTSFEPGEFHRLRRISDGMFSWKSRQPFRAIWHSSRKWRHYG